VTPPLDFAGIVKQCGEILGWRSPGKLAFVTCLKAFICIATVISLEQADEMA